MKFFKCSEATRITIDPDSQTVSIYLKDEAGIFTISLPELLALNAKAIEVSLWNEELGTDFNEYEELPKDLIQHIQDKIAVGRESGRLSTHL